MNCLSEDGRWFWLMPSTGWRSPADICHKYHQQYCCTIGDIAFVGIWYVCIGHINLGYSLILFIYIICWYWPIRTFWGMSSFGGHSVFKIINYAQNQSNHIDHMISNAKFVAAKVIRYYFFLRCGGTKCGKTCKCLKAINTLLHL